MTEFKIAAIPTKYRGRMYRSRLEAKWAAFFTALGWSFEYEPYDLGKWSPDFILFPEEGMNGGPTLPVLVEVKPIVEFDESVASKMFDATKEKFSLEEMPCLLLLGLKPQWKRDDFPKPVRLGWHTYAHWENRRVQNVSWQPARFAWLPAPYFSAPKFYPDIVDTPEGEDGPFSYGLLSEGDVKPNPGEDYQEHTMKLWAQATNAVQWRGEESQP